MFKRRCKITFVCHGSTIYSTERRLYDRLDYPPLDENGKEEIQNLAHWLKKSSSKNDAIYVSPTLRSIQSAEIIAKKYGQEFEIMDELKPKDEGLWGALSFEEIQEKYPGELELYHQDPIKNNFPKAESIATFNKKNLKTLEKIIGNNLQKRIIIVADQSYIRSIVTQALDIPVENHFKIRIPTGSATQVNFYKTWNSLIYSGYVPS